ncbi:MAG: IS66 family insertion sequence element accessory protein TnpA [Steroidobacteraceae bacterium]
MIQRRTVETWRELVARQVRSGLSVQAFCRQERLNAWTFYGWRSRLRESAVVAEDQPMSRSQEWQPAAGFIDLGALGSGSSRCEIRLELGGGIVLRVVRG